MRSEEWRAWSWDRHCSNFQVSQVLSKSTLWLYICGSSSEWESEVSSMHGWGQRKIEEWFSQNLSLFYDLSSWLALFFLCKNGLSRKSFGRNVNWEKKRGFWKRSVYCNNIPLFLLAWRGDGEMRREHCIEKKEWKGKDEICLQTFLKLFISYFWFPFSFECMAWIGLVLAFCLFCILISICVELSMYGYLPHEWSGERKNRGFISAILELLCRFRTVSTCWDASEWEFGRSYPFFHSSSHFEVSNPGSHRSISYSDIQFFQVCRLSVFPPSNSTLLVRSFVLWFCQLVCCLYQPLIIMRPVSILSFYQF